MESISRLSSLLETARDLTIEAAQSAGAARTVNRGAPRDLPFTQVKKLLESKFDREVLQGLRQVISMIYRSKPCLPYFSAVIKNIPSPNLEIKKLVYIYLLHYAESEPDLALLSINTIQKSLSDQSPQVRALALRVMSGIKVPVISQIVSLAIKKGVGDMSPHVRKAAALAIPKCYRLDPNTLPQLTDYLSALLGDRQYFVVGPAVVAFTEVCPDRIDLLHKHYRSLVRKLVDMDEWGQLALVNLLTTYARKCFPQKTEVETIMQKDDAQTKSATSDTVGSESPSIRLDPDLELFLQKCQNLLTSRNPAVIVAVVRALLYVGTLDYLEPAIGPLIALLRTPQDCLEIVLYNIVSVCLLRPLSFVPYATRFLIHSSDGPEIYRLKMEVLTLIFPLCDVSMKNLILTELEHFTGSSDTVLIKESIRAIGRCAQNDQSTASRCMSLLLKQAVSEDDTLVAEALTVVRLLIQQDPEAHTKTIIRLAKNLDTMINSYARANVIWLIGEYVGMGGRSNIAPDVLRILAKGFADEEEAAKLQIVVLAAKVYLHHLNSQKEAVAESKLSEPGIEDVEIHALGSEADDSSVPATKHPVSVLWDYILLLVRYDTSYDLRDRTRLLRGLLSDPSSTELATLLLFAPKPVPHNPSPSEGRSDQLLGSSSLVLGEQAGTYGLSGYEALPDWVKAGDEPDPRLREELASETGHGGRKGVPAAAILDAAVQEKGLARNPGSRIGAVGSNKDKSLDDWLAEDDGIKYAEQEQSESEEESSEYETDSEEDDEDDSEGDGDEDAQGHAA